MAYDGLFIKAQINEIKSLILNEHIAKITQKSHKEVDFCVRKNGENLTLTLSTNPNFPHILLTKNDNENFETPPIFCMLLRKYLQGALIKNICQINYSKENEFTKDSLERIIEFEFTNINEFGDIETYYLFIEIMGKYSNLILTDKNYIIIDLLNKTNDKNARLKAKEKYSLKNLTNKIDINKETKEGFIKYIDDEISLSKINNEQFDFINSISKKYAGLSKPLIQHIITNYISKNNKDFSAESIQNYNFINNYLINECDYANLLYEIQDIVNLNYNIKPCINYKTDKPSDLYIFALNQYVGNIEYYENINECLYNFINQKFTDFSDSTDKKLLINTINSIQTKLNKKLSILNNDIDKTKNCEIYKVYAELISAFGYDSTKINNGVLTCNNYNDDNNLINIPIDESKSIAKNVEYYYDKFNKLKRTKENATIQIEETISKIEHLDSILSMINISDDKNDLFLIKEELINSFSEANKFKDLKTQKAKASNRAKNKNNKLNYNIHHYKSTSGIDIYLGKNNLQNEYLTFTLASPNDTWLHIKGSAGSHVIIKKPYTDIDDKTLVEAASLAAYFSDKKNEAKATVDYTLRKELKKVKGKPPGFCIYHKNFSINVKPEIIIKEI